LLSDEGKGHNLLEVDRMSELLAVVMSSEHVALAFPDDQADVREQFHASPQTPGQIIPSHSVLSLGDKGALLLSSSYVCKDKNAQMQQRLVRLTDAHLAEISQDQILEWNQLFDKTHALLNTT